MLFHGICRLRSANRLNLLRQFCKLIGVPRSELAIGKKQTLATRRQLITAKPRLALGSGVARAAPVLHEPGFTRDSLQLHRSARADPLIGDLDLAGLASWLVEAAETNDALTPQIGSTEITHVGSFRQGIEPLG